MTIFFLPKEYLIRLQSIPPPPLPTDKENVIELKMTEEELEEEEKDEEE
jgi:hypothetical protein